MVLKLKTSRSKIAIDEWNFSFNELPNDVLFDIFSLLEVVDILSLRVTCQHLNSFSRERSVWRRVLKSFHRCHAIPIATFESVEALNVNQMEQIVKAPHIFERDIVHAQQSLSTFRYLMPLVQPDDCDNKIFVCRLIPGGRWLITGGEKGYLRCWDLGEPWFAIRRAPVAQIMLYESIKDLLIQHSEESVDLARVLIQTDLESEDGHRYGVLSLDLSSSQAVSFTQVANIIVMGLSGPCTLEGDIVAIQQLGSVIIWNWKENVWLRTAVASPAPLWQESMICAIKILPPYVLLFNGVSAIYAVFRLPNLSYMLPYEAGADPPVRPSFQPLHSSPLPSKLKHIQLAQEWKPSGAFKPNGGVPTSIAVATVHREWDSLFFSRYAIISHDDSSIPTLEPLHPEPTRLTDMSGNLVPPITCISGLSITLRVFMRGVVVHFEDERLGSGGKIWTSWDASQGQWPTRFAVCPLSGRACLCVGSETGVIRVLK